MTKRFHVKGQITRTLEGEGATYEEAVRNWQAAADGGYPDWGWQGDDEDEGRSIISGCETCGQPIFEGEKYFWDEEGSICKRCLKLAGARLEAPGSGGGQKAPTGGGAARAVMCEDCRWFGRYFQAKTPEFPDRHDEMISARCPQCSSINVVDADEATTAFLYGLDSADYNRTLEALAIGMYVLDQPGTYVGLERDPIAKHNYAKRANERLATISRTQHTDRTTEEANDE